MQIIQDLQWRISQLPDEELLAMLTTKRVEYRQPALDLAAKELMRRGIDLPPSSPQPKLTPRVYSVPVKSEDESEKRREQLIILVGLYALIALLAWGYYTDSSEPTRFGDRAIYWLHIVLALPVVLKICALLGKKLLDKV